MGCGLTGLPHPIGSMYGIYGDMDPINIPQMLAYIPYMDPMGPMLVGSCSYKMVLAVVP